MKRFTQSPVYNPNTTQEIRKTLIESGRQDLADGIVMEGIRNLEAKVDLMQLEVNGIKNAQRETLTETGVWRVVEAKLERKVVDWGAWAVRGVLAGAGTLALTLLGWLAHLAWRGAHT